MIRRPPRSTLDRSSAASDVYKRQGGWCAGPGPGRRPRWCLSLIHISEPTRQAEISYAVFCLKKKKKKKKNKKKKKKKKKNKKKKKKTKKTKKKKKKKKKYKKKKKNKKKKKKKKNKKNKKKKKKKT